MIDHQHVARLIAWCEERTHERNVREIATALRIMQDERLDILAALHLPDHGPVGIVEEIKAILRNWDNAEDRAAGVEEDDTMMDLDKAWGLDKLPYKNAQATHECPERERHLQTIRWDLEGDEDRTGLFGPAVTHVQQWSGRWWAHNQEYATEVTFCPWCGELLDRVNSPE